MTITATDGGFHRLNVRSFNAAGNVSDARVNEFLVAFNSPTTSLDAPEYYHGQRVPVTLTARQEGAATFTYVWEAEEGQPEHTVPVGPTEPGAHVLEVYATFEYGGVSGISRQRFDVI